jgi:thiol-disulfide isomerase/thioredoxin
MRRFCLSLVVALATIAAAAFAPGASAAERAVYAPEALAAAQAAGKPVVVHVTAPWCSTCAAQAPIVLSLMKNPKYKDLVLLLVDFDTQKAALQALDVRAQSTFVVFKGKREVGRSIGETDKDAIEALFDKAS